MDKVQKDCISKRELFERLIVVETLANERKETGDARFHELNNLRKEYTSDREKDQKEYMRKDVYEKKIDGYDKWVEKTNGDITEMKTRYDGRIGLSNWLAIGALLISIIVGIILLLKG